MATNIFASIFGFAPKQLTNPPNFPYNIKNNPYQAKRSWPPDFTQLSQRHQFILERRYRRRAKLKWARPTWTKAVKLAQWGSILFVCFYGVFYLDVHEVGMGDSRGGKQMEKRRTVFDGVRGWYDEQMKGFRGQRDGEPGGTIDKASDG